MLSKMDIVYFFVVLPHTILMQHLSQRYFSFFFFGTYRVTPLTQAKSRDNPIWSGPAGIFQIQLQQRSQTLFMLQANHTLVQKKLHAKTQIVIPHRPMAKKAKD